jgi:cytochrome c peroxidase
MLLFFEMLAGPEMVRYPHNLGARHHAVDRQCCTDRDRFSHDPFLARRKKMKARRMFGWMSLCVCCTSFALLLAGCAKSPPADSETPDMTGEKPAEQPAVEQPAVETPAEQPAVEQPAVETPAEQPAVEQPATETPAEQPAVEQPAVETPAEQPAAEAAAFKIEVPLGLPPVPVPEENPMTAEKVELGKLLYFDKRLSKDGTVACATCHDPQMAWTEHKATSTGIDGQVGGANSPTVINAAYATAQFWDGRAASLEEQALGPIENPIEMGHKLTDMIPELNKIDVYKERFQAVFGTDVTSAGIAQAIAAFERTILSGNSPYDKFQAGDESALNEAQKAGMQLFEDAGCSTCHTQPLFSNYRYYNAGVGMDKETPDAGRKGVTGKDGDLGKFRVPSLREVANTGPYFHDGSGATLEAAVALMASGGVENPNLSAMIKAVGSKELTEQDRANLVEFLKALSGEFPDIKSPELP